MTIQASKTRWYALEKSLALAAAAICLLLTVFIWSSVSQQQAMWPLPALYFFEMVAAGLLGLWGVYRNDTLGSRLAWAAVGALIGFAFMGAFSVGLAYLPVAGLLGLAALWQDRQDLRRLALHLGLALLAAVAQAALMLALIQVLYPGTVS